MAKLVTTKEKYGISVATRIEPSLAQDIAHKAESLGISMSKMVGMLIVKGATSDSSNQQNQQQLDALRMQLNNATNLYKNTAAEFICDIADNDNARREYALIYNEILATKKDENEQ